MEFTIKRNKLLSGLNTALKAVSTNGTIEVLSCIYINATKEGIELSATDLEIGIKTSLIEAIVSRVGNTLVESKILIEIVKKFSEDVINVSCENNSMIVKCGKSKFTLKTQPADTFPGIPEVEKEKYINVFAGELKQAIKQTLFCVSIDSSKPAFTGELFEISDGILHIVAVDGFRIAYRYLSVETEQPNINMIIPSKPLSEIQKLLSNDTNKKISLYYTNYHALFELEDCIVVTRLIEGQFLEYKEIFMTKPFITVEIDVKQFMVGIDRVALISGGFKKTPVILEVFENHLTATSNTEIGNSYEEIQAISICGEAGLKIGFNPKYLLDILNAVDCERISLQLTQHLNPLIFKPILNDEKFKYLILPLRLK